MPLQKVAALTRPSRPATVRLRLSEIARLVGGTVDGPDDPWIHGVAGLRDAQPGELSFLAKPRYRPELETTRASAVLLRPGDGAVKIAAVRVEDPALAFLRVVEHWARETVPHYAPGVHPTAQVDPRARLGRDVHLGPHVVVEADVEIGDRTVVLAGCVLQAHARLGTDVLLHPNVVVRDHVEVGNRVIVHPGAVLGSDGFGYVPEGEALRKVPHIGRVVLEDDVEVGANACIDRATTGETRIGRGTKLDNLVQVAHNVHIGPGSILCAQVGISGSTRVGAHVQLGGQAGLVGHIELGDGVRVGAQGGVSKSVAPGTTVSGSPAQEHRRELRQQAALARLPEHLDAVRELRQRLAALEAALEQRP